MLVKNERFDKGNYIITGSLNSAFHSIILHDRKQKGSHFDLMINMRYALYIYIYFFFPPYSESLIN